MSQAVGTYSRPELLDCLRELGELPDDPPTTGEIEAHPDAPASLHPILNRWDSLGEALEAAGYDLSSPSAEELIHRLDVFVGRHGRVPLRDDVHEFDSITRHHYESRFGSWRDALYAAGYPAKGGAPATPGGHPCAPNGGREVDL